ncbi:MAG: phage terminase small subunit P27 family [Oribacterium sp.]|nr:phage terminase small subunit P27 family [Oribacterium sp.]
MVDQQKEKKTPACPKWLLPEAKTEWRRLAKKIHIRDEEITAFAGYCQSYARWREAEEYVTEHGSSLVGSDGSHYLQPQVSVAQTYLKLMNDFAERLGLTPVSGRMGNEADGRDERADMVSY